MLIISSHVLIVIHAAHDTSVGSLNRYIVQLKTL